MSNVQKLSLLNGQPSEKDIVSSMHENIQLNSSVTNKDSDSHNDCERVPELQEMNNENVVLAMQEDSKLHNTSFLNVESLEDTLSSLSYFTCESGFLESFNVTKSFVGCNIAAETCSEFISHKHNVTDINIDEDASNLTIDSGIHDSKNNVTDNVNINEFNGNEQTFSENCGIMSSNFNKDENSSNFEDEEFSDAGQCFKDPTFSAILESAGSSNITAESPMFRSSPYKKLDPLISKHFPQYNIKGEEMKEVAESEMQPEFCNLGNASVSVNENNEIDNDKFQIISNTLIMAAVSNEPESDIFPDIHETNLTSNNADTLLHNVHQRKSYGKLLYFDSPIINKDSDCHTESENEVHDSCKGQELTIQEAVKLDEFSCNEQTFSENSGIMSFDFIQDENVIEFKNEDYIDACQFFKDPTSLAVLESAGSSNIPVAPSLFRSSLYKKFDPVISKYFPQYNTKVEEMKEIASNALQSNISHDVHGNELVSDIVNKRLSYASLRQSHGNLLLSFDHSLFNNDTDCVIKNENIADSQKMYTKEEMEQVVKIQELTMQEIFLKKQKEFDESIFQWKQKIEAKYRKQIQLSRSLYFTLKEFVTFVYFQEDKEILLKKKLEAAEKENYKLTEDLETSTEDIQNVEHTFSDFHKRYDQCKKTLKIYINIEKSLKQQLENVTKQLREKEEICRALQFRIEEVLENAKTDKNANECQIVVLKAQLKKAELNVSSLERVVENVKLENENLTRTYDELIAKFGTSD